MAKYSTGSSGGGDEGDACELCGRETGDLRKANVAGADLLVCSECQPHDDTDERLTDEPTSGASSGQTERDTGPSKPQTQVYENSRGDSSRWEEQGTDYEEDRLPYLVSDYGDRLETARQNNGLTLGDLVSELEVEQEDVLAVEQGRASRAGVGGSVVRALEQRLDIRLIED